MNAVFDFLRLVIFPSAVVITLYIASSRLVRSYVEYCTWSVRDLCEKIFFKTDSTPGPNFLTKIICQPLYTATIILALADLHGWETFLNRLGKALATLTLTDASSPNSFEVILFAFGSTNPIGLQIAEFCGTQWEKHVKLNMICLEESAGWGVQFKLGVMAAGGERVVASGVSYSAKDLSLDALQTTLHSICAGEEQIFAGVATSGTLATSGAVAAETEWVGFSRESARVVGGNVYMSGDGCLWEALLVGEAKGLALVVMATGEGSRGRRWSLAEQSDVAVRRLCLSWGLWRLRGREALEEDVAESQAEETRAAALAQTYGETLSEAFAKVTGRAEKRVS